ncbi:MAG TPA: squalene synthase HpnC [Acidimicrobiales bacterium]|jgi:squalene synthase HpnC|nr:squalene synthase HpnC [Acidimicrobiales bacterium]
MSGVFSANDDFAEKARHENFPVASRFLPRDVRSNLMAIYAFARLTDDVGDEAKGDRLTLLDELDEQLDLAAQGAATDPTFQRLSPVIRDLGLSLDPFQRLIEANRMDQRVSRYQTFDDLVEYCMLSAAPVGEMVLGVFGLSTPERRELSDKVCIALQLVEHLQDVQEDARRGRVYLPLEDMERFGCVDDDLLKPHSTPAVRRLVVFEVGRARELLAAGVPLAATLPLRPRVAVAGFTAGGVAALDSIKRAKHDVLGVRCRPSKSGIAQHMARYFVAASLKRVRA